MKIKKGDNVIVLTGKQKKETGEVLRVIPTENRVVVSGINKKQSVKRVGNEKKFVTREHPIHLSNVALVDPKTKNATRVGFAVEGGKKVRIAKKSGQALT